MDRTELNDMMTEYQVYPDTAVIGTEDRAGIAKYISTSPQTKLQQLIDLIQANPNLPVKFMTHWDVIGEDSGYWVGDIQRVERNIFWADDERIYMDEDEIKDKLYYDITDDIDNITDADAIAEADRQYEQLILTGKAFEAIIVYINN